MLKDSLLLKLFLVLALALGMSACSDDDDDDGDDSPAVTDNCPDDPNKTEPGACGCGVADTDSDGDGTPDCNDACPNDATDTCNDEPAPVDSDGDGVVDAEDGCPNDANKTAPGACGCGIADTDSDGDGTPDCNDACPNDATDTCNDEPGEVPEGITAEVSQALLAAGLEDALFFGAVDPNASTAWWHDWSYSLTGVHPLQDNIENGEIVPAAATDTCPAGNIAGSSVVFGVEFPVCLIAANDSLDDVTLTNDFLYLLAGNLKVGNGSVEGATPESVPTPRLTIEAGTQIMGYEGASMLRITRGAQIDVQGTREMPVIMASVNPEGTGADLDPTDLSGRGKWGGLAINGFAEINTPRAEDPNAREAQSEAAPTGDNNVWFGGENDADDSGSVEYLIIAESGFEFRSDQEVQGLTVEGVGSGTHIDYLEVFGSEDDGIEWFGGTVSAKHVIINDVDDDGLDMDEGWRGTLQYAIVYIGSENGDQGIESDGNGSMEDVEPWTAPILANLTILGNTGKQDKQTAAVKHREGFGGRVYRSVYTDFDAPFERGCIDIDDEQGGLRDRQVVYGDVLVSCVNGTFDETDEDQYGEELQADGSISVIEVGSDELLFNDATFSFTRQ